MSGKMVRELRARTGLFKKRKLATIRPAVEELYNEGSTPMEIADELGITHQSVYAHIQRIKKQKLKRG